MLAPAELLQTIAAVAPDAVLRNLSTEDVPKVLATFGEGDAKATVTLYLDPLDPGRWLSDTVVGGKRARTVVVHGAGSVAEQLGQARAAAGLPEPPRPPQPSHLSSLGGEQR